MIDFVLMIDFVIEVFTRLVFQYLVGFLLKFSKPSRDLPVEFHLLWVSLAPAVAMFAPSALYLELTRAMKPTS